MDNTDCSPLFEAVIETTEEAILNALLAAEDMQGYDALTDKENFVPALKL